MLWPQGCASRSLRGWLNGWVTRRRFQDRSRGCIFGCEYEDSLEHYAHCKVVADFSNEFTRLAPEADRMADFLALAPSCSSATRATV